MNNSVFLGCFWVCNIVLLLFLPCHSHDLCDTFAPLSSDDFKCPVKEEVMVTSGEWEVLANHGAKVKPCTWVPTFTAAT